MHPYGGYPVGTAMGSRAEGIPLIRVVGTGRLDAAPDTAVVTLGVTARAEQAATAYRLTAEALSQIVQTLLAMGIPREQLQTGQISVQPVYEKDRLVGYEGAATLRVTLTDLSQAGAVIDQSVAAGANMVLGVQFEVRERGAAEARALALAVQDAQQKAVVMARSLGVSLGPVWRAEEEGAGPAITEVGRALAGEAIPVLPGTLPVVRRVTLAYMIRY